MMAWLFAATDLSHTTPKTTTFGNCQLPCRSFSGIRRVLIGIAWIGVASMGHADDEFADHTSDVMSGPAFGVSQTLGQRWLLSVESGMALDEVENLFGRKPDRVDTVGACAIMQTSDWVNEGVRVLSTGSQVISVVPLGAGSERSESLPKQ